MALKPTIYKFVINLSDMDRNLYETLNLTVAQHPSESVERMMARVLAYCLNATPELTFTKGVSATDEPDIWEHDLSGSILKWIEIGEPSSTRLKKASRLAERVTVYSINTKSDIWWSEVKDEVQSYGVSVNRIPWHELQSIAAQVTRTTTMAVSITEQTCYLTIEESSLTAQVESLSDE